MLRLLLRNQGCNNRDHRLQYTCKNYRVGPSVRFFEPNVILSIANGIPSEFKERLWEYCVTE
jgi:hypothetical protein